MTCRPEDELGNDSDKEGELRILPEQTELEEKLDAKAQDLICRYVSGRERYAQLFLRNTGKSDRSGCGSRRPAMTTRHGSGPSIQWAGLIYFSTEYRRMKSS